ncbi:MAG TPA: hypothetical protein VIA06_14480 [Candidatus Dormibacteraeota bacterium]|jgi:hypothetical protein|nr:hypothetical protein [Candidatus Dormibacteraeota bacterium]
MKLQLTIGNDAGEKKGTALAPLIKAGLVGLVALAIVNRQDIRRYLRLRRM